MKFPVNNCMGCGFDLTTVKPAEVNVANPGEEMEVGTCPQCSAPYFLVEDAALPLDAPGVLEPAPEPSKSRSSRRRAAAPEPPAEPEPAAEPEPEE